jgi:DNA-binding transcriptional ArsR family regulator
MRRDVYQAIADPNRRAILGRLSGSPLNLNQVAEFFNISRSAVSQHMKILTECGLVVIKQNGRERFCEAKFEKLDEVTNWIGQYRNFWVGKFDNIEMALQNIKSKNKKYGSKK